MSASSVCASQGNVATPALMVRRPPGCRRSAGKRGRLDGLPHGLSEGFRFRARGPVEEGDELLAAVAGDDVSAPPGGLDDVGHGRERDVPLLVAVVVVVVLEVVDVEHHERDEVAGLGRAVDLDRQALAEEPEVVEAGEGIGDRALVGLAHEAGEAAHALDLQPVELLQDVRALAQQEPEGGGRDLEKPAGRARANGGGAGAAVRCPPSPPPPRPRPPCAGRLPPPSRRTCRRPPGCRRERGRRSRRDRLRARGPRPPRSAPRRRSGPAPGSRPAATSRPRDFPSSDEVP